MALQGTAGPWGTWGRGPEVSFLGNLTLQAESRGIGTDGPAKAMVSLGDADFLLGALKPPGILGLKTSEPQTLDFPEGVSEFKNLAVVDTGGQQASSGKLSRVARGRHVSSGGRQGQSIPEPHILVEAETGVEDEELHYLNDPVLAIDRWGMV